MPNGRVAREVRLDSTILHLTESVSPSVIEALEVLFHASHSCIFFPVCIVEKGLGRDLETAPCME